MRKRHPPQVNTPRGRVTLDVETRELIPFLDRLLAESCGEVIEPSASAREPARFTRMTGRRPKPAATFVPGSETDPDHHLWNNHGVWFAVYTIYPTPVTKERIRHSLQTRDCETARLRRDHILAHCVRQGILAPSRRQRRKLKLET